MSLSGLKVIMGRIDIATPSSQIAVFIHEDRLHSVFADTAVSKKEIAEGDGLVGVYDKTMDPKLVREELRAALAEGAS